MMNKVMMTGRLVKEPILNYAPVSGTAYVTNSIAVESYNPSSKTKDVDFHKIVSFGKTAENLATNTDKGCRILIEGRLVNSKYEVDKQIKISTEIIIEKLFIIDFAKNNNSEKKDFNNINVIDEIPEILRQDVDFLT